MAELALVALLAFAAGLLVGWLLASPRTGPLQSERAVAQTRAVDLDLSRRARDEVERERNEAQQLLAAARAEAGARDEALTRAGAQLAELTRKAEFAETERARLDTELAALRSQSAARAEAHEANLTAMRTHFEAAAGQALEAAQTRFLDRAHQRFTESEKLQGEKIAQLLAPVNDRLSRYERTVEKVEAERRSAFGELDGQIKAMREGQERVSSEAARLVNALRNAPKARGRWGEQQLRNVLETCGLAEHTDFAMEVSVADGEGGRLRPDAIVRVPGGKSLIIDAKVSLNSYQDAINAIDEADRKRAHEAHALSMRTHVTGLSGKSYWQQFEDTPEYVVMFVPGEHFLTAALEHDPSLWDFAFDKRVLLATPTNLIAIARTVDAVWKQEKLATEAREIGALGKEIYARIQVMAEHLGRMSKSLDSTVDNYNKFIGSLDSNVLTTAKRLEAYKMDGGKPIESPPLVDRSARGSAKLIAMDGPAAP